MSVGPLGNNAALSGTQQESAAQVRRSQANEKAEQAAGLGPADADQETADRDADGRRLWEFPADGDGRDDAEQATDQEDQQGVPKSKDASGIAGKEIDLSG